MEHSLETNEQTKHSLRYYLDGIKLPGFARLADHPGFPGG